MLLLIELLKILTFFICERAILYKVVNCGGQACEEIRSAIVFTSRFSKISKLILQLQIVIV